MLISVLSLIFSYLVLVLSYYNIIIPLASQGHLITIENVHVFHVSMVSKGLLSAIKLKLLDLF